MHLERGPPLSTVSRSSHTAKYFIAFLLPSGALHLWIIQAMLGFNASLELVGGFQMKRSQTEWAAFEILSTAQMSLVQQFLLGICSAFLLIILCQEGDLN